MHDMVVVEAQMSDGATAANQKTGVDSHDVSHDEEEDVIEGEDGKKCSIF